MKKNPLIFRHIFTSEGAAILDLVIVVKRRKNSWKEARAWVIWEIYRIGLTVVFDYCFDNLDSGMKGILFGFSIYHFILIECN